MLLTKKHYIVISLIWLTIAVVFAAIIRSSFVVGMGSWFNYKYFLHTHSHLAFLGWIFNIIYYFLLKQFKLLDSKKYGYLFIALNISVLGMLLTFPFQGYALWSIIFSTLHILISYIFAIFFYKDTKGNNSINRKFAIAAIVFMVVSSIGPFSLAPIIANGLKDSIWYDMAIYFYLHFQYNGWFLLSIISMTAYSIKIKDNDNWQRAFNLFVISTILNFSLSTLWTDPGWVINIISVLSSLMQFHALFLMSKDIFIHLRKMDKFKAMLMKIIYLLFILKIFFALAGSIQEVAMFVYYNRNLVIGYLHLIFLGIVTPFFFIKISEEYAILNSSNHKLALIIYLFIFLLSELLLTTTSVGFNGDVILFISDLIVYTTWILAGITIYLSSRYKLEALNHNKSNS
ncbi:MAG: hypothetical protein KDC55_00715 [Ignavibacteriae bacterium]|nr:hypothetical protein [Ignavibacteriota bacterium]MCB9221802.1 hypothetical protein [Ignavibacteria bacterium]